MLVRTDAVICVRIIIWSSLALSYIVGNIKETGKYNYEKECLQKKRVFSICTNNDWVNSWR